MAPTEAMRDRRRATDAVSASGTPRRRRDRMRRSSPTGPTSPISPLPTPSSENRSRPMALVMPRPTDPVMRFSARPRRHESRSGTPKIRHGLLASLCLAVAPDRARLRRRHRRCDRRVPRRVVAAVRDRELWAVPARTPARSRRCPCGAHQRAACRPGRTDLASSVAQVRGGDRVSSRRGRRWSSPSPRSRKMRDPG